MLTEYVGAKSFFGGEPQLPLWSGYAIVLGFGAFFSVVTTAMVYLGIRCNKAERTSEGFSTAGRTVKTGLTAAVTASQWTWAATLLQSSDVAWNCSVSSLLSVPGLRHHGLPLQRRGVVRPHLALPRGGPRPGQRERRGLR